VGHAGELGTVNDQRPKRPRFQFGLRKLLLWTAVVATLLGVATTLGIEVSSVFLSWIILVWAIRRGFGAKVAAVLSVAAWAALGLVLSSVHVHPGPGPGMLAVEGAMIGGFVGLAMFGIAEGLVRAVNWADNLMRTKSDGETGGD
jgi:hypothetical protein